MSITYERAIAPEYVNGLRSLAAERDDLIQQVRDDLQSLYHDRLDEMGQTIRGIIGLLSKVWAVAHSIEENEFLMRETP